MEVVFARLSSFILRDERVNESLQSLQCVHIVDNVSLRPLNPLVFYLTLNDYFCRLHLSHTL